MSNPTILLIGGLTHTNSEWQACSKKYTLKEYITGSREDFVSKCKAGEFDGVVGLYRSNTSVTETGPFDREVVAVLPKSLKSICHNGAGYDNIDVQACTDKGLLISSTPVVVDDATADVGILLMLQATAHRARAFGMKIQYHNRSRLPADLEGDAKYVSINELLASSDVLSLNLSLNANTRHIISAPEFAKMKDGVVIVNTARGAIMNERDLVAALENGKVGAAGLDVFENEPEIEAGLLKSDKVFILPHVGTMTVETQRDMDLLVLHNLESAVDTGKLLTPIPEQMTRENSPGNGGAKLA